MSARSASEASQAARDDKMDKIMRQIRRRIRLAIKEQLNFVDIYELTKYHPRVIEQVCDELRDAGFGVVEVVPIGGTIWDLKYHTISWPEDAT